MAERVLHFVTSMDAGGIETMLMNQMRALDRRKVTYDFVVHRDHKGFYEEEIEQLGGRIYRLPSVCLRSLPLYLGSLDCFLSEMREAGYSIVHSHISVLSALVMRAAKRNGFSVRVAHSHEYHESLSDHKVKNRPFIFFGKKLINLYTSCRFACSTAAGSWLFGNSYNVRVISNAINCEAYTYHKSSARLHREKIGAAGRFVVGHVGNFSKAKNYPFILEVFSRLLEKKPDSMLVLVGKNESNPWVEERIKELGIQDSVILTGVRSDIPDLLKAMDAFLFPSLHEGLPVTLVEAQASGIKCLVSDAVTEEVKITDNLEFMSLEKPAEAWADKLLEYADGYERQDTYQQIVDAGYDIQSNVRWLENFYLEAAERARQSA